MEWLNNALEKNKTLNAGMFFLTLLGTIITIVIGWPQFYKEVLAYTVSMPVWAIFVLTVAILVLTVLKAGRKKSAKNAPLEIVSGKDFGVQQIHVGGKRYIRCRFQGTEVVLDVSKGFGFESCEFSGVHFTWGEEESKMMLSLAEMYADESFRPLIENMFDHIRTKNLPEAPPRN